MRNRSNAWNVALAALLAITLTLAGCGGGSVDIGVTVPVGPAVPDFDVVALINGTRIAGVDVYPGESQTIAVPAGDAFELDSSGPVFWDFSAGGSADIPAAAGGTILYRGASINETAVGESHLVFGVSSTAPAGSTIPITIYVTSQNDSSQFSTIQVLVSN
jgi:hypothetical protein